MVGCLAAVVIALHLQHASSMMGSCRRCFFLTLRAAWPTCLHVGRAVRERPPPPPGRRPPQPPPCRGPPSGPRAICPAARLRRADAGGAQGVRQANRSAQYGHEAWLGTRRWLVAGLLTGAGDADGALGLLAPLHAAMLLKLPRGGGGADAVALVSLIDTQKPRGPPLSSPPPNAPPPGSSTRPCSRTRRTCTALAPSWPCMCPPWGRT